MSTTTAVTILVALVVLVIIGVIAQAFGAIQAQRDVEAADRWPRGPDGHVIVCTEAHGPRPTPGHEAAHSCGVRRCVNPRHLRWATTAENHADKHAHGTDARGERNPAHRLTADQVVAIRSRLARGEHMRDLAVEHGVVPSTIQHIAARTTWAWLTPTMEDQQ